MEFILFNILLNQLIPRLAAPGSLVEASAAHPKDKVMPQY